MTQRDADLIGGVMKDSLAVMREQADRIAAIETELAEARKDGERLDKLERQHGPVALRGSHLQLDGSYQMWWWEDQYGTKTFRRRSVRECIDDIKEAL